MSRLAQTGLMSPWHIYEKMWEEGLEEACLRPLIAPKSEDSKYFPVWRASHTALTLGTDSRERVCGPDTEITWFRKRTRGIISKCYSWMGPRALVHLRPPACDYRGTRLRMGNPKTPLFPDTAFPLCLVHMKHWGHTDYLLLGTLLLPAQEKVGRNWVSMVGCRHPAQWGRSSLDTKNLSWKKKKRHLGKQALYSLSHGHSGDHQQPLLPGYSLQEALAEVPLWYRHTLSWPQPWEHPPPLAPPRAARSPPTYSFPGVAFFPESLACNSGCLDGSQTSGKSKSRVFAPGWI